MTPKITHQWSLGVWLAFSHIPALALQLHSGSILPQQVLQLVTAFTVIRVHSGATQKYKMLVAFTETAQTVWK